MLFLFSVKIWHLEHVLNVSSSSSLELIFVTGSKLVQNHSRRAIVRDREPGMCVAVLFFHTQDDWKKTALIC